MAVMDEETGQLLNYRQLLHSAKYKKQWSTSSASEFGWLANGIGNKIKNPTNTIQFIHKKDIHQDRKTDVTYGSFVCSVRSEKKEKNCGIPPVQTHFSELLSILAKRLPNKTPAKFPMRRTQGIPSCASYHTKSYNTKQSGNPACLNGMTRSHA